jgi:hypothetical protein
MTQVTLKITKSVDFKHLEVIHKNNSSIQELVCTPKMWNICGYQANGIIGTQTHTSPSGVRVYVAKSTEQQEYFWGTLYIVVDIMLIILTKIYMFLVYN